MTVSFEQKIRLGFSLAVVFLFVLGGIAYWAAARSIAAFRGVDQTHEVLGELDNAYIGLLNAETSVRGYVSTGDDLQLKPYRSGLEAVERARVQLRKLTRKDQPIQRKLDGFEPVLNDKLGAIAATIQQRRDHGVEAASKMLDSPEADSLMNQVRIRVAEMEVMVRHQLEARSAKAQAEARSTIGIILLSSILGLVLVGAASVLLRRGFRKRLQAEAERDRLFQAQKQVETQIVQLNADLQLRAAQLAAVNKELEAFSYSVSHDLRAPLRHLSGFVDLLKKHAGPALDAKSLHHLESIRTSAQQMGQLVDDLLQFSRMARTEIRLSRVNLSDLVGEVREHLQHDLHGRAVDWKVGPLPEVRGDPAMLRIVLTNLLSNAVKYTRPRPRAKIEIGSQTNGNEHIVFIRDNGVGFDMKYVGKLFGVFQRLHFEEEFEGTGIGLASVRRILLRHGGRVWAEGVEGEGATFYFALPRLAAMPSASPAGESGRLSTINSPLSTSSRA